MDSKDMINPGLHHRLVKEPEILWSRLSTDPRASIAEEDIDDCEIHWNLSSVGEEIKLRVWYRHLRSVMDLGSQELLVTLFQRTKVKLKEWSLEAGEVVFTINVREFMAQDEAFRMQTNRWLSCVRWWLLIGPLLKQLRWLRRITNAAAEAADRAAPGDAREAARREVSVRLASPLPAPVAFQVRDPERCWILHRVDSLLLVLAWHAEDEDDISESRAFCVELAETSQKSPVPISCSFHKPEHPPQDLRAAFRDLPVVNIGFLAITYTAQLLRRQDDEMLIALARTAMGLYHELRLELAEGKRLVNAAHRATLNEMEQQFAACRKPEKGKASKRLANGKEFCPPSPSQRLGNA